MRRALAELEPATRRAWSARIADQLEGLDWFRNAPRVAFYASLPDEVATEALLAARWRDGAAVFLPRMRADGALDFVAVRREADLRASRHGIREPRPDLPAADLTEIDVVVVPGLAFDATGLRLGRGGGYYDRTFGVPRLRDPEVRPRLVGVAFALQILDALPRAAHDLHVDLLITEHGRTIPR